MKHSRLLAAGVGLALAAGGQSLLGRGAQSSSAGSPASPFDSLHFRQIGPAAMSGRIADIAVYEANANIWYIGAAHGGVWKTTNNGTTWEPQLQDQGLMSIGDIAVSQSNPDLVYVGTGESNNRQSTSWGDGVYKSTDGGKSYTNVGLKTSRHINRIVIDPRQNDTVFVAATGPLFGPGGERGVFKTTDGGRTWKQTLKVDDDTGANDLAIDPSNDTILYASTYQRRRTACCMNGGGPGSGIWKSTDAGETWTRLKTGLPDGSLGRIGLDVYRRRPNILYAAIEGPAAAGRGRGAGAAQGAAGARGAAGAPGAAVTEEAPGQAPEGGRGRGLATAVDASATGLYRSDDAGASWRKVNNVNPRPMYFSQVRIDPNDPEVIYMGGVDLQMSTDGGKSVNTAAASAIHSDHHAIWIDPANSNHVMIGNDGGLAVSWDMAKTWTFVPNLPVGLFYHVSVDMATPFNVCGGMQDNYDWCGPSQVRGAGGIANYQWTTIQGGDGFVVLQDPRDNRVIYSESQDGNIVRVDRVTNESISIRPQPPQGEAPYRWMWDTPIVISPHDPAVVYIAANRVFRAPDRGLTFTPISPDLTSNVDRDTLVTMGLKGSDITIAKHDGIVAWGTIVALAESPKKAGLLYAGTDDGNLQVTRDGGKTWTNVYGKLPNAPKGGYVSRIAPSRYDEAAVYATIDDHRQNNYGTYVYVSGDYGQTWKALNGNLSSFGEVVVKTITEDQKNPDVLYLGAETGLFVSVDRGGTWWHPKTNLPTVRVDEITLHPRDNAMVLATHGRALWILDHLEPIQEFAAAQKTDAKLFTPPPSSMFRRPARDRNYEFWGNQAFFGENPPQAALLSYYVKSKPSDVKLKITDAAGRNVREIAIPATAAKEGLNAACWDLRVQPVPAPETGGAGRAGRGGRAAQGRSGEGGRNQPPADPFGFGCGGGGGFGGGGGGFGGGGGGNPGPYVLAGSYNVALVVDGKTVESKPVRVVGDPEVMLTDAQRKQLFDMGMEMHDLQRRATEAAAGVASLNRQAVELAPSIADKPDIPADVKSAFESLKADAAAMAPKLPIATGGGRGGGGGGRGGADVSITGRIAQAKNGMMAGMWPTSVTMKAYADAKTDAPKALSDANALFAKAAALSASLAKYNITLTAPKPVETGTAGKKKATVQ
ncbi:MAG TPA: hypothetical protein VL225_18560 [Vicinamibacterales bacterium]|jgi:photosystem II stability/assembly factor-like uncharacterized protein|nr:hypothetical protein [Vicinamibacterales bacterium]